MWHTEIPPDAVVYNTSVVRSYGTLFLIRYQMINIIIKHDIHISSKKSRLWKIFGNKWYVAELSHDALRQMGICRTWTASQPTRVEGNIIQRTSLIVIDVCVKVYILYCYTVKIHPIWSRRIVSSGSPPSHWSITCISHPHEWHSCPQKWTCQPNTTSMLSERMLSQSMLYVAQPTLIHQQLALHYATVVYINSQGIKAWHEPLVWLLTPSRLPLG